MAIGRRGFLGVLAALPFAPKVVKNPEFLHQELSGTFTVTDALLADNRAHHGLTMMYSTTCCLQSTNVPGVVIYEDDADDSEWGDE